MKIRKGYTTAIQFSNVAETIKLNGWNKQALMGLILYKKVYKNPEE
jgi:hypothetical protein